MKEFSHAEIDKILNQLDFSKIEGKLIPVIAQDYISNEVLMLAFADQSAIQKCLETGFAYYFSRSRQRIWKKGESSGHVQEIKTFITDCDNDSVLIKVKQNVGACHKGYYSCFFKTLEEGSFTENSVKIFNPEEVYEKPI
ncbi:MAG: phosphoribosyl-AMP cyclohydrolase [Promethearchaeota archaeon]|jgi:phosphoribosyl-AMP cyclohydrolase